MSARWTARGMELALEGIAALDLRASLHTDALIPGSQAVMADVVASELAVSGYARQALGGVSVDRDDGAGTARLTCSSIVWAALGAGASIRWVVVYDHTGGSDAVRAIIAITDAPELESGSGLPTNGGQITATIDAEGLLVAQREV